MLWLSGGDTRKGSPPVGRGYGAHTCMIHHQPFGNFGRHSWGAARCNGRQIKIILLSMLSICAVYVTLILGEKHICDLYWDSEPLFFSLSVHCHCVEVLLSLHVLKSKKSNVVVAHMQLLLSL